MKKTHPIMYWLIPPKREKLERILAQFNKRTVLLDNTYLCGIPLSDVAELFETTVKEGKKR